MVSVTPRFRAVAVLAITALLVPTHAALALPPPVPKHFALPMPAITAPAEPYGAYQGQSICTTDATPGALAFQKLILSRYRGSRNLGITRGCGQGGRSEHKEGRAWDWGVRVDRPAEKAMAEDLIGWLLATDATGVRAGNARRLGIMYIIWNRKIWTASRAADGWRSYFGPNPHTDHVHFSWTWAGAQKLTSYWTGTPYGIGSAGGRPDPAWGTAGWLAAAPADSLRLVNALRWSDGRFWLVSQSTATGQVAIEERLPTGALGSAFGGSGRTRVAVPPNTLVRSAVLTSAGTVVVAGVTVPAAGTVAVPTQDMFAMRITAAGRADPTFGSAGSVVWDLGGAEDVAAVAMAGSDVVLAGSRVAAGAQSMVVARLTTYGAHAAFGTAGAYVAPAGGLVTADSALPRPDGSIVVGCRTAAETCVAKLTAGGVLDPTWGGGGVTGVSTMPSAAVLAAGPGSTVYATFQQADGYAGMYRLNAAGLGDPTFGYGQYWLQPYGFTGCANRPTAMTVRSDGTPVIAGVLDGCGKGFVARLTIDGPLDPTWGTAGVATFDTVAGQSLAAVSDVALQADGHVVVAASAGAGTAVAPSLGRLTISGPLPARTVATRSAASTPYGGSVTVSGVVRSTSTFGLASGVPVSFETRPLGSTAWTPVGTGAVTTGGVATLSVTPTGPASYRVVSAETNQLYAATSGAVDVRVSYALAPKVVGPAAPAKLYARQGVTLSVTAQPARPGRRVWLQRYSQGKWRTLARPLLDASSSASFRFASQTPTTGYFRWVIFGDALLDGFTTNTVPVVWAARPVPPKPAPTPVVPTPTPAGSPTAAGSTPPAPPNASSTSPAAPPPPPPPPSGTPSPANSPSPTPAD